MRPQDEESRRCHAVTHSYIILSLTILFRFKCLVIPIHIIIMKLLPYDFFNIVF